ncbi:MAG: UDP-glucose--hexose-1-phosphate uridylyltransferase [Candidatus Izimaplasma sp.]|nr:UDP-glucose--hexose-1-phosphate uridylyltransferase [Candidatus Izimaplasma bacterium]
MKSIYQAIEHLYHYGLSNNLLEKEDRIYVINKLCDLLSISTYETPNIKTYNIPDNPAPLLTPLLDFASKKKLFSPDTTKRRDIFEAKIMDQLLPRPSTLNKQFELLKSHSPKEATDFFYRFSKKSNYIKTSRTSKNIQYSSETAYGTIKITINLSKPEKDPQDIIDQKDKQSSDYPKCLLCKENVGYNGETTLVGRTSHRVIPVSLNNEPFNLQYSPYVYYNEHCIVFHENHIPMNVSIKTFKRLFDFLDQFPHYFLGSNAGLPIVGGSILAHEHYQGGHAKFPIEDAKIVESYTKNNIKYDLLYWPLSVIRLSSDNKETLTKAAMNLFEKWQNYSNPDLNIYAKTNDTPHNAITPIARKKDDTYILDMTLRNNKTSEKYPLGIFHPHPENHHIKKENIGLIEVMGLAVLPARLKTELPHIKQYLKDQTPLPKSLDQHRKWTEVLKTQYTNQNLETFINHEVAKKFVKCIEDSGVFKQTEEGQSAFKKFFKEVYYV